MSRHVSFRRFGFALAPLAAALTIAGCGGGDGTAAVTAPTTVGGSVVKGPVSGAQVCAYLATSSGKGTQLGCTTTNASGVYSLQVAATGDMVIEATGGSYTDEAGAGTLALASPMQVVVGANAGGSVTGVVTPLTTIAYTVSRSGSGGVSVSSFGAAVTQVATSFGLSGTNLVTTVPTVSGAVDAYGRMLRAISQYLRDNGTATLADLFALTDRSTLQTALQAAYLKINDSSITLNLGNLTTTTPGGSTGGSNTLTVSFVVNGAGGASIPAVTIPNVPAPAPGTFCSALTSSNAQLAALAQVGTVAISNCAASGNTYTVNVTVTPTGLPAFNYTVTYAYT